MAQANRTIEAQAKFQTALRVVEMVPDTNDLQATCHRLIGTMLLLRGQAPAAIEETQKALAMLAGTTGTEQEKELCREVLQAAQELAPLPSDLSPANTPTSRIAESPARTQARVWELIQNLQSDNVLVRCNAAKGLGEVGPAAQEAVPALIQAMRDREPLVRAFAGDALGKIGPAAKDAIDALIAGLNDPDKDARQSSARALGQMGPAANRAAGAIYLALRTQKDMTLHAIVAMKEVGVPPIESVGIFIEGLKDDRPTPSIEAMRQLVRMGELAVPALVEVLSGKEGTTSGAVTTLARIGPPAIPALMRVLGGPDGPQCMSAGMALTLMGKPAVPALIEALRSNNQHLRWEAAFHLRSLKDRAQDAIGPLEEMLKDPNESLREEARVSLECIRSAKPRTAAPSGDSSR